MPQASSRQAKRITLVWGGDKLSVDDPIWIAKIEQEMAKYGQPTEEFRVDLSWPRSRMRERVDESLVDCGLRSSYEEPEATPVQMGYQAPEQQDGVAVEALRLFLGLELPVALNFTSYRGRSEHRMSAVHTAFRRCWGYSAHDELTLEWIFSGYQLYASHHIGDAHFWPYGTETSGHVERRLLNGQWVRWGFDGASTHPPGRPWSSRLRKFTLAPSGIQRIEQTDSNLWSEYSEPEFDSDAEDGIPPSQEAK